MLQHNAADCAPRGAHGPDQFPAMMDGGADAQNGHACNLYRRCILGSTNRRKHCSIWQRCAGRCCCRCELAKTQQRGIYLCRINDTRKCKARHDSVQHGRPHAAKLQPHKNNTWAHCDGHWCWPHIHKQAGPKGLQPDTHRVLQKSPSQPKHAPLHPSLKPPASSNTTLCCSRHCLCMKAAELTPTTQKTLSHTSCCQPHCLSTESFHSTHRTEQPEMKNGTKGGCAVRHLFHTAVAVKSDCGACRRQKKTCVLPPVDG